MSSNLFHFCIVRSDMTFGQICAQLTHAAGESAALFGKPLPPETIAVVLASKNEEHLIQIKEKLDHLDIEHVSFYEPDFPFNGAMTAIGVIPRKRDKKIRKVVSI